MYKQVSDYLFYYSIYMITENNKKWPSMLVATMWFLWGIVAISGIVWYNAIGQTTSPTIAFVTQQFLTTTPFGVNPNGANPGNPNVWVNPNAANPANPNAWVNPANPGNPAGPNPMAAALFGKRNFLFQMVMSNPNPPASPMCKVKWVITTAVQPGVIHFEAQPDPANARIRCGLIDLSTNLLVDLAPVDVVSFDFVNVPEGKYDVVCLVWKPGLVNIMNSFNFCSDGVFAISATGVVNPPNPVLPIDLELYGQFIDPSQGGVIVPVGAPLKYVFKVGNVLANGWVSSGAVLRFLPQNLTNIVATGSVQSGAWYEWNTAVINPGSGVGLEVFADVNPTATGAVSIVAELCNYTNDVDSQPCNMVNLTPAQDDEIKL